MVWDYGTIPQSAWYYSIGFSIGVFLTYKLKLDCDTITIIICSVLRSVKSFIWFTLLNKIYDNSLLKDWAVEFIYFNTCTIC